MQATAMLAAATAAGAAPPSILIRSKMLIMKQTSPKQHARSAANVLAVEGEGTLPTDAVKSCSALRWL